MSAICKIPILRNYHILFVIFCFFSVTHASMAELSPVVTPSMQVHVDKKSYEKGDILILSGTVKHMMERVPITIQILSPDLNLVHVEQIDVSQDGTFSVPIKLDGPLWRLPGNYTIIAQNGFAHISTRTTFEFQKEIIRLNDAFSVVDKTSGQVFNVNYTITGGKVKSMTLDQQNLSLVALIEPKSKGSITFKIPRLLIDAKTNSNVDESFLVFINDDEINSFNETSSDSNYRVLIIPFSEEDSKIDIIGTTVIPEFANISGFILVTSIVATLVFSMLLKMKSSSRFYFD